MIVAGTVLAALAILLPRRAGGAAPGAGDVQPADRAGGSATSPSVSPDGTRLRLRQGDAPGNLDLYSQRIGAATRGQPDRGLPGDDTQPAFSPDGSTLAFRSEHDGGGIFLMGATGESVRRLTDFGYNPAWSWPGHQNAGMLPRSVRGGPESDEASTITKAVTANAPTAVQNHHF